MNNGNFIATDPRTVVQYTIKCETTTKIYIVRKLNTLTYAHYVIFFGLCVLIDSYLELFVVFRNKYFFEIRFVSQNIRKQTIVSRGTAANFFCYQIFKIMKAKLNL